MNIHTEKLNLIQWLAGVSDSKVIRQFMLLKRSNEEAAAVADLSEAEKDAIDRGLKSIKEGRFKSHKEVAEVTKKNTTSCLSNPYANPMVR